MAKQLYIETVGCQMNVLDSELVVASLRKAGYELVDTPAEADAILFNTCSVRQHAEDKIYSALGRLKHAKKHNPHKIIGVLGCMAQKDQELIFERAPYVDLVVGPGPVAPDSRADRRDRRRRAGRRWKSASTARPAAAHEVERSFESYDPLRDPQMRPTPFQAFVRIMIGCDKFCTYCIVPSVRGPEQSRPAAAHRGRSPPAGRRGLPGDHAAGPDRQQLPAHGRRPHDAAGRPARPAARHRRPARGSSSSRTIPRT